MVLTSAVMSLSGATDVSETKNVVNTTCAAGVTRDVVIVMKEIAEDHEKAQSKGRGSVVTVIDQKMVITQMVTTKSRTIEGNQGTRRRARPSCWGVCLLMSLRMIFVLPLTNLRDPSQWMSG